MAPATYSRLVGAPNQKRAALWAGALCCARWSRMNDIEYHLVASEIKEILYNVRNAPVPVAQAKWERAI